MKKLAFVVVSFLLVTGFALAAELTDPVMITSIGQSADLTIAKAMFKKAGVDTTQMVVEKLATSSKVPDSGGTVVLVVGASNKGLGEARISADSEIARAKSIIAAAHKNGSTVVLCHIGGKERRGEQSDAICKAVADEADFFLVKKDGDTDGLFAGIAKKNDKTYAGFDKITEGIKAIKNAYSAATPDAGK